MNDIRAQDVREEIIKLKKQEIEHKKNIERLRNENATKQEQIDQTRVSLNFIGQNQINFKGKTPLFKERNQGKKTKFG